MACPFVAVFETRKQLSNGSNDNRSVGMRVDCGRGLCYPLCDPLRSAHARGVSCTVYAVAIHRWGFLWGFVAIVRLTPEMGERWPVSLQFPLPLESCTGKAEVSPAVGFCGRCGGFGCGFGLLVEGATYHRVCCGAWSGPMVFGLCGVWEVVSDRCALVALSVVCHCLVSAAPVVSRAMLTSHRLCVPVDFCTDFEVPLLNFHGVNCARDCCSVLMLWMTLAVMMFAPSYLPIYMRMWNNVPSMVFFLSSG